MRVMQRVDLPEDQKKAIEEIMYFEPGYKFQPKDIRCLSEKRATRALKSLVLKTTEFIILDYDSLLFEKVEHED